MNPTHFYDVAKKRIVPIENDADEEESSDAALDAFISTNGPKILAFLRELLASYERGEAESEAAANSTDESRVRQDGAAQLGRGTESDEEPPESVEKEPDEMPQKGRRGESVAWRNGKRLEVGA